tara:strand:+ start:1239 stop:1490 length:252 start_codon:yes stop_codon:yes gene_type:complete
MITVQCTVCGVELHGHETKTKCCGCPNMTTVCGEIVSAVDMSKVIMLTNVNNTKKTGVLTDDDLKYQEARRQRKVRKINFEER